MLGSLPTTGSMVASTAPVSGLTAARLRRGTPLTAPNFPPTQILPLEAASAYTVVTVGSSPVTSGVQVGSLTPVSASKRARLVAAKDCPPVTSLLTLVNLPPT